MEIRKILRDLKKQLSDLEWSGSAEADKVRAKIDMLEWKLSIGETHEVDF